MSPSHTTANSHTDPAAMHGLDFLVSLLVHALVIIAIIALALWKSKDIQKPLQRIQVSIITPAQLDKMVHHAAMEKRQAVKPHPEKPHPQLPKEQAAKMPQPKEKALSHPSKTLSYPKAEPKTHKNEKPYNPFAPLESKSDVTSSPVRSNNSSMVNMQRQQLSQQEVNRYIAMIQEAVERQWKVPVSLGHVSNPLVELKLRPDGSIVSINILESSGDPSFDASLSRAIRAAAPFQLPQKQYEAFSDMKIRFVPLVNQQQ